ncbi:hypothetical protein SISSUDRAFT_963630, partial [Sistotremastrum suecicum HHB10207 ss-3]
QEVADALGVHRNTVLNYMKTYGIEREYSVISDAQLDALVQEFRRDRPDSGHRYVHGFVRDRGFLVQ